MMISTIRKKNQQQQTNLLVEVCIRLIHVEVDRAEYWDSPASVLAFALGYAKAVVTGETPHIGENAKVDL